MSKIFTTKTLVYASVLTAISIVLRLLGFPQSGVFRIEFGFLPIVLVSFLYGPVVGGISYIVADIVGTIFTGMSPFFPITVCKFFIGVIYGLFLYKKEADLKRITLSNIVIFFLIDLVVMPFALLPISGGKTFFGILGTRVVAGIVNLPLRIVSMILLFKYIKPEKIGGRGL